MTTELLEYLTLYGAPAAALALALGQFGIPMPTSLALLALGALTASGDADLTSVFAWALTGATCGDQAGFFTGRFAIRSARDTTGLMGKLAQKAQKAKTHVEKWGGSGVFFTRWLLTPLGPAVNIASGAGGLPWRIFAIWALIGEALWVSIYIGLGFAFGTNIEALAGILGNLTMALAMLALAGFLGWRLMRALRTAKSTN